MGEKLYFCITFQAIHNKDYSVVKTTKGAEDKPFVAFFISGYPRDNLGITTG